MVKLKRLHIKNLQSVKDCTIEFNRTGVYHLAGKHNIGKSAIVKAINALFRNVSRFQYKYYLRDNEKTFSITGEFWDGSVITLSRGENDYYEWKLPESEGNMPRTDGKVPDEIKSYLNLYIDEEKTNECLNIRTPRSVLLFVDTTQGDNYFLFQKALRTEEFILATRLANRKKNQITNNIKQVNEYKEQQEMAHANAVSLYHEQQSKFNEISKLHKSIEQDVKSYQEMETFVEVAKDIQELATLLKDNNINDSVINDIKELDEQIKLLNNLTSYIETLDQVQKLEEEYESLKNVVDVYDELKQEHTQLNKLLTFIDIEKQVNKDAEELSNLEEVINLFDETHKSIQVLNNSNKYMELDNMINNLDNEYKHLDSVVTLFNDIEINKLNKLTETVQVAKEMSISRKQLKQAEEEHIQADTEMLEFMKEFNFCPIVAMTIDKKCPFGEVV